MSDGGAARKIEEGDLLAYIDGAVDQETRERIETLAADDPALSAEIQALAEVQRSFDAAFRRSTGPTTHELGEHALGLLPPERSAEIDKYLAEHPDRAHEAEDLRRFLSRLDLVRPPAPEPGPVARAAERVSVIMAQLVSGLMGGPALAPVPVGVRGEVGGASYTYQAGEGQVVIEVQPDAGGPALRMILGLLLGIDRPAGLSASLYYGDELVASTPCDELGNFTLPGIAPGAYDLILRGLDLEVLLPGVVVG